VQTGVTNMYLSKSGGAEEVNQGQSSRKQKSILFNRNNQLAKRRAQQKGAGRIGPEDQKHNTSRGASGGNNKGWKAKPEEQVNAEKENQGRGSKSKVSAARSA